VEHPRLSGSARSMEPFGASGNEAGAANPLKEMVGTRGLELLTSTVSNLISTS
jgi:hypothetical protein